MDKVYNSIVQQYGGSRAASETIEPAQQVRSAVQSTQDHEIAGQAEISGSAEIDPSMLEALPDLDVFEFFDTDFQLDAMDAALADNTALAFSLTLTVA